MHGGIPIFVHARLPCVHARDGLSQRFCLSIGVQQWVESSFFPFLFFQKESEKQEVGVPSLPGGGWGGDGRVHASGANLDLYPAGFYYFYFYYFYY